MRLRFLIVLTMALLITVAALHAQSDCPSFVEQTLTSVNSFCESIGRDQACYGNQDLEAIGRSPDFAFSAPGDIEDVGDIEALRLASMQFENEVWGVVLMRVRASISPDTSENVTMALFGDVNLVNRVPPTVELPAVVSADTTVYSLPDRGFTNVISNLDASEAVIANGRLEDSSWIRIVIPTDPQNFGWVQASALQITGDVSSLVVATSDGEVFGPMQAFFIQTGADNRPCAAAPNNGILIQTPQGVGEINFLINEVEVRLGSTAFFSTPNNNLNIAVLAGQGEITSEGETEIVEAGMFTTIPLDDEGFADGIPTDAELYDEEYVEGLPDEWLPLDVEEDAALDELDEDAPDDSDDDSNDNVDNDSADDVDVDDDTEDAPDDTPDEGGDDQPDNSPEPEGEGD